MEVESDDLLVFITLMVQNSLDHDASSLSHSSMCSFVRSSVYAPNTRVYIHYPQHLLRSSRLGHYTLLPSPSRSPSSTVQHSHFEKKKIHHVYPTHQTLTDNIYKNAPPYPFPPSYLPSSLGSISGVSIPPLLACASAMGSLPGLTPGLSSLLPLIPQSSL